MTALTALVTSDERTGKRYDAQLSTSLTSVGFFNIRCVNGKEAHNIMEWRINKTADTNNVLYVALTGEEYISLEGGYTGLQANMRKPLWEHMIHNTCPFDSLTTLLYLFSERKIASAQLEKLCIDCQAQQESDEYIQQGHHYNKKWQFDEFEQQSVQICELCHYNILDIFKRFKWTNGFAWDYNALINLNDLQVMEYTGLYILKRISTEHHDADHHTWCYMQNQEFYPANPKTTDNIQRTNRTKATDNTQAYFGNVAELIEGLRDGEDIEQEDPKDGCRPIHAAIICDQEETLQYLIRQRADVEAAGPGGLQPLALACRCNAPAAVRLLKAAGARGAREGETLERLCHEAGAAKALRALRGDGDDANEGEGVESAPNAPDAPDAPNAPDAPDEPDEPDEPKAYVKAKDPSPSKPCEPWFGSSVNPANMEEEAEQDALALMEVLEREA
ncbi:unnamed protein product [Effrenium voratum]|nr:unnamed protein product [Effrenium voratum]